MLSKKIFFRNNMRKLLVLMASLLILMPLNIWAIPNPSSDFYVNDYANVLNSETKDFIMNKSASLDNETKAQIVVLTVENLDGKDSNSFAIETARQWGIGGEKEDNGVLILLALEEREIRVEIGRGLEGALNDAKVGRIIDNEAMEFLSENDFDRGILALYKGVLSEVMIEYNISSIADYEPEYMEYNDSVGMPLFETIVLILIIVFIISTMPKGPRSRRRNPNYNPPNMFGGGFYGGNFGGSRGGFSGGFKGGGGGFSGGGSGRKF